VLQNEWLNSRGAIARFERDTIEIRVLDSQETPAAELAIAIGDRAELLIPTIDTVGVDAIDLRVGAAGPRGAVGLRLATTAFWISGNFLDPAPTHEGFTFLVDLGPYVAVRSTLGEKVELGAAISAGATLLWLPPELGDVPKGAFGGSVQLSGEILPAKGPVRPLLRGTVTTTRSPFGPWLDLGVFVGLTARSD